VRQHVFYSKVTQSWRRMFLYLPPDYDTNFRARYPVLYLQHGAGEDEGEWIHAGRAHYILDNLLAGKKIVPMIVVMNNGFATKPGSPPAGGPGSANRFAAFEEMLVKDVIPEVDSKYRTIADRDHRALAGLSMGGMQTFQIGPAHLDLLSYLGMFSGTPQAAAQAQVDAVAAQGTAFRDKVHLLWFGVGTAEANFYTRTQEVRTQLEKAGIPSGYYESPGTAHEFQTWRRCLREFAPLLFRASAAPSKAK
jgi:enterochelin esterase-like enzyme